MKKFLALLLAALMVVSMVGCGKKDATNTTSEGSTATTTEGTTTTETGDTEDTEVESDGYAQYLTEFTMEPITTALAQAGSGTVGYNAYAGEAGKDYTDAGEYTFHDYMGGTTGINWSPANWETADDSSVLDYISSGFYGFALNADKTGWAVTCELAAAAPEDVTADYVGKYGIEAGETAKAWKIALKDNLTWEDGTPITAEDIVWSYQQLLDPIMKNRRADSLYAGDFAVVNAKNYFYAGAAVLADNYDGENFIVTMADLTVGDDGVYADANGNKVYLNLGTPATWLSGNSLFDYVGAYGDQYFDLTNWEALCEMADENGYVALTEEVYNMFVPVTTTVADWGETEDDVPAYFAVEQASDSATWDEVGIFATDDNAIVFVTVSPIVDPNYYVPYNLSSSYIMKKDLWESLKRYFDADGNEVAANSPNVASVTTTYGTSVETSCSYGPYMVTYFEMDKQITLSRNENWFGYSDGMHEGQYQTDTIIYNVIVAHDTALLEFLSGNLESVSLQQADMAQYGTSEYINYTPQSYTTKLTWNTDLAKTTERGTQIMTSLKFRQAFAYAIDRSTFASSYTTGTAGYGMLNGMYVYDPFTGASYRDTDGAKAAIVKSFGLTYGDDGDYDDLDEAYDAVTGYDLNMARNLMAQAYVDCKAEGLYNDENVALVLRVYNSDDIYVQMFNFLKDALESACVGTGFEGKVTMEMVADADYYETNYSGGADMIFTTWGGSAYSPYTLLYECYCDASDGSGNQMEYGFDTSAVMITMNIDGKDYTDSLQGWALWCDSAQTQITSVDGSATLAAFGDYDAATRATIFGNLEYAYLANFVTTPIYYRSVSALLSQKVNYASDTYVDLVGFGGLQYVTYNYTDAEWDAIKGSLTY